MPQNAHRSSAVVPLLQIGQRWLVRGDFKTASLLIDILLFELKTYYVVFFLYYYKSKAKKSKKPIKSYFDGNTILVTSTTITVSKEPDWLDP
jgi:hypothetical protein